jgi:hypothetical protein
MPLVLLRASSKGPKLSAPVGFHSTHRTGTPSKLAPSISTRRPAKLPSIPRHGNTPCKAFPPSLQSRSFENIRDAEFSCSSFNDVTMPLRPIERAHATIGLRILDLGTGRDSPLSLPAAHDASPTRRLSTPRRRRSVPNAMSKTRSRRSENASPSRSRNPSRDVHAVSQRPDHLQPDCVYDAVELIPCPLNRRKVSAFRLEQAANDRNED